MRSITWSTSTRYWLPPGALGLVDFGYRAFDSMRMEKAYRLWGADISADFTPWEAGMDMFVKLDKGDFIGRDALVRQKEEGITRSLACITVDCGDAIPLGNEAIRTLDGEVVGYVSAAEHGHVIGEVIALGIRSTGSGDLRDDPRDRHPRRVAHSYCGRRPAVRSAERTPQGVA